MEMIVNTVRMIDHDQAREFAFGNKSSLKENLALAYINPEDFNKLGLVKSLRVELKNKFGSVILAQKQDDKIPQGIIVLPVSLWSNQITGVENDDIINKNLKADVKPTRDPITDYDELIKKIKQ